MDTNYLNSLCGLLKLNILIYGGYRAHYPILYETIDPVHP